MRCWKEVCHSRSLHFLLHFDCGKSTLYPMHGGRAARVSSGSVCIGLSPLMNIYTCATIVLLRAVSINDQHKWRIFNDEENRIEISPVAVITRHCSMSLNCTAREHRVSLSSDICHTGLVNSLSSVTCHLNQSRKYETKMSAQTLRQFLPRKVQQNQTNAGLLDKFLVQHFDRDGSLFTFISHGTAAWIHWTK